MSTLLNIPKIGLKSLSEKEFKIYHNLDTQPYGESLALNVTEKLVKGEALYHSHRDYCGLGLFFHKELYTLGTVYDGYNKPDTIIATFEHKIDFITWLTQENDQSMALYGEQFNNQPLNKIRLAWFLEDNYSPIWNDYCGYIRDLNKL